MHSLLRSSIIFFAVYLSAAPASAHNVWAHCQQITPEETVEAFRVSGSVYDAQRALIEAWFKASSSIELGVMAEFEAKVQGTKLAPEKFLATYEGLQEVRVKIKDLGEKLGDFKQLVAKGRTEPSFDAQLTKILAEQRHISRVSLVGTRYSDVAGKKVNQKPPVGIAGVIDALIEDLHTLDLLVQEVIEGTRDAIPLALKGDFSKVMLSGRNAFGDKMPQLSDMISSYERFYNEMVLATIMATMQVYPKGFEFLQK